MMDEKKKRGGGMQRGESDKTVPDGWGEGSGDVPMRSPARHGLKTDST